MSLYLPDCTIGALSKAPDAKFVISGKDAGGMKVIFVRRHQRLLDPWLMHLTPCRLFRRDMTLRLKRPTMKRYDILLLPNPHPSSMC